MTNKRERFICYICFALILLFVTYKIVIPKTLDRETIKQFVTDNQNECNLLGQQIESSDFTEAIYCYGNILNGDEPMYKFPYYRELCSIVKWVYIREIFVEVRDGHKTMKVVLKSHPKEYDRWGIYYSDNNMMIDSVGKPIEYYDDLYIKDDIYNEEGKPYSGSTLYVSARICENWFYYQEKTY